jgi:hypothetical protein
MYGGHGVEILELTTAWRLSDCGRRLLDPALRSAGQYRDADWPLPFNAPQARLFKLRGDSNVPACQHSAVVDLVEWVGGPWDFGAAEGDAMPICTFFRSQPQLVSCALPV